MREAGPGQAIARHSESDAPGINVVEAVSGCVLATGNDDGEVRLWDMRLPDSVARFNCHDDYISAMIPVEKANRLVASSSDGTLSVMDFRALKVLPSDEPRVPQGTRRD